MEKIKEMEKKLYSQKVCHVSSVHSCFDTRIFHRECKTLKDAGYKVTYIGQGGWIESYPQTEDIRVEYVEGIKVISFPPPRSRFRRILWQFKLFKLVVNEGAKVYHLHDPELMLFGAVLKIITNAKIIYDIHENYTFSSRSWIPRPLRKIVTYMLRGFMRFIFRYFDGIIAVTNNIKQKFEHKNLKVVRNVYFNEILENLKFDKQKNDKHLDLIFAGGIIRVRGIDRIVRVLDVFEKGEVTFKLIGKFNDPGYRQEITSLPGFRNVEMMGWQPHDVVMEEMAKADVGILTLLLNEVGLPNKMFEYMGMGLPIIASDSPGWREIIEGNGCGLIVDLADVANIQKGIQFMLENPQERIKMGQNGIKATIEKYNWAKDKENLLNLYKELI